MSLAIGDIHDFVAAVELENIVVHEERARRLHWTDEELETVQFPLTTSSLGMSNDGISYRFRFRTRFTDRYAEYVADFEAVYAVPKYADVAQEILSDFASRVAFMAVYPFLRASIFGSAARLGQPIPVLGIVRQGEFDSGDPMTDEQVTGEFHDNRSETVRSTLP